MKCSAKEVSDSIISIVENKMSDYLKGAMYLSKVEFTGKVWPYLFIFLEESASIQQQTNNVVFTLRFLDVAEGLNEKMGRDLQIKSDMIEAASILIDYLQNDGVLVNAIDTTFSPVYVQYGDGLSGIQISINFPIQRPCVI